MRVRYVLLSLFISLLTHAAAATEEEELPALELLGFIADFSDENEGWVDPQELEELFSLGGEAPEPDGGIDENTSEDSIKGSIERLNDGSNEGSAATEEPGSTTAAE